MLLKKSNNFLLRLPSYAIAICDILLFIIIINSETSDFTPGHQIIYLQKMIAMEEAYRVITKRRLEKLSTITSGSGLNKLYIHLTNSNLSSSSLFTNFSKNQAIRNVENSSLYSFKHLFEITSEANNCWRFNSEQQYKVTQLRLARERINHENLVFKKLNKFKNLSNTVNDDEQVIPDLSDLVSKSYQGSMHPYSKSFESMNKVDREFSERHILRGLSIQIKGPRKGNKAIKTLKVIGKTSTNSVEYVIHEQSKLQLPTKLGIYGLSVKMIYQKFKKMEKLLRDYNHGLEKRFGLTVLL